jgi:hypothetical protein
MVDGKCREFVDEIKRLIAEGVNPTPDVKIFAISLNFSKTFLATHLFNDSGDSLMDLLKGKQLE